MKRVDDFRLRFGNKELVPIVIGGMGVDISTAELALEAARLGGIGHISDAMVNTVADRRFNAKFVKDKLQQYKFNVANSDKSVVRFDLAQLAEATHMHIGRTMEAKRGEGLIFVNCMEKLTMNAPRETLRVRMAAALDAGIDGITLAAGMPNWGSSSPRCARCSSSCARRRAATACRTTSSSRGRWPAAISVSAWTGSSTIWRRSSPRSIATCRRSNSTFR
jgi:NAD(P)H-dependent flavin oxidoreductase YrpB (nitropropane dioxygenase family)